MSLKHCKSILIPVDFSQGSLAAAKEGIVIGGLLQAKVTLLHVIHDPTDRPGFYHKKKAGKAVIQHMGDAAEEMMAEFVKENGLGKDAADAGVALVTSIVRGVPPAQILAAADKIKACMIVMGSMGRTGWDHMVLGSRAERVVQMSRIPVLVVK